MDTRLEKLFDEIHPSLAIKSRMILSGLCEEKKLPSGTRFIEVNTDNNSEYFLIDGVARSCMEDENGSVVTIAFFEDNSVITPNLIRTRDKRSTMNFESITKCTLLEINAELFGDQIRANQEIEEFANLILKNELIRKVNKEIQLISYSSIDRLKQFRKDFKMLENRVPHSMIASYLGITPESLSRLRKSLSFS